MFLPSYLFGVNSINFSSSFSTSKSPTIVNGRLVNVGEKGLEPSTSASQKQRSSQLSYSPSSLKLRRVKPVRYLSTYVFTLRTALQSGVARVGLEPTLHCCNKILSLACIPISPPGRCAMSILSFVIVFW